MTDTAGATPIDDIDAAFIDGYERYVRLASSIVGSDGEDAVVDAFLRVRSRDRKIDRPAAYLRTAIVNECRSRLRRHRPPPPIAPAFDTVRADECDVVWAIVTALPSPQATIVALRFYEDLTVPQIAAVLRMAEGTVKSHLHRAIAAMRAHVDRDDHLNG